MSPPSRRRAPTCYSVRSSVSGCSPLILFGLATSCWGTPFSAESSGGAVNADAAGVVASGAGAGSLDGGGTGVFGGGVRSASGGSAASAGSAGSASDFASGDSPAASSSAGNDSGSTPGGSATVNGGGSAPACASGTDGLLQLSLFPDVRTETAQELHPFFEITGRGVPVALERVSIRYYFTNESTAPESASCYFVTGNRCDAVAFDFGAVANPTATATRYLELRFRPGTQLSAGLDPIEVRVGFAAGYQVLRQSNDYSFDSAANTPSSAVPLPYKSWTKVTLYVDDALIWGSEPCIKSPSLVR